ncbi:MAG TPA: phytanoyl-CoA dioxygenase family protein [Acidimicrobiales bacterium]|nr:phytanoyl-CoA dioxygenase family protein [Acidimicrobiales bacterium]
MASVDLRTRTDAGITPVDAGEFFGRDLPALIDAHAHLAVPGARQLSPKPFAIEVDGHAWTLSLTDDGLTVTAGADGAAAVAVLDAEELTDLVHDVRTPMGFFTGGDLDMPQGRLNDFLDWWVVLRSLLDQRPVHTTGAIDFRDARGEPLALDHTFKPDDDRDDMSHFLAQAGFLHIGGLFTEDEMNTISADMDAAMPSYVPDDGRSWWAKTSNGDNRLVRMEYFHEHSETTRHLLGDERFLNLANLTDDGHRFGELHTGWNMIEALVKPLGIVEGISDLPWHKDCSLGRHSYRCCSLTVGISVTGADADTGQLRVVAGSHRALVQPAPFVRRDLDLPQVDLPTQTGDVTVHLSCTLHMSQAPVTAERRVMYTGFRLPDVEGTDSEAAKANEKKIGRIREGAYKTVSQVPSPAVRT